MKSLSRTSVLFAAAGALAACADDVRSPLEIPGPTLVVNAVVDYGANPADDGGDDTQAIQNAVNSSDPDVYIPKGTYLITKEISVSSGKHIYGDSTETILKFAPPEPQDGTKADSAVFKVKKNSNITVEKLKFVGPGTYTFRAALRVVDGKDVTFQDNVVEGLTVVSVVGSYINRSAPANSGDFVDEANELSSNIKILRNNGKGPAGHWGAIDVEYTQNAHIIGNVVNNYPAGITWIGSHDAAKEPGMDAWYKAAKYYQIRNNTVTNIYHVTAGDGGCIWGGSGDSITVVNNTVRNCADIGLDAEGSSRILFYENWVYDGATRGLGIYFYSRDVVFQWNYVEANGFKSPLGTAVALFGTTSDGGQRPARNVGVYNNKFVYNLNSNTSAKVGLIDKEHSQSFELINNWMENVRVRLQNGRIVVGGNDLKFTHGDLGKDLLCVGHTGSRVKTDTYNNTVTSNSSQSGWAINVYPHSDDISPDRHAVNGNTINGFARAFWINEHWSWPRPFDFMYNSPNGGSVEQGDFGEQSVTQWCPL